MTVETAEGVVRGQFSDTLEFLRQLVSINSHTANPDGVNQVAHLTAGRFAAMGFRAEFVPHSNPSFGNHLILTRQGRSARTIALVSHLDTVFTAEEERRNQFHWQPEGERIYGPGTIDIKGGTAMMYAALAALSRIDAQAFDAVTWVLLWNSAEETLSDHFFTLCQSRLDPGSTLAALVFESEGRPNGRPALVTARKGRATLRVTVEGRSAHAGAKHPRGANAITQMGRIVDRIAALTDYARDLTVNVGLIRGGTAVNRVPDEATAELELRAFSPEAYHQGVTAILALSGPGDVASPADGFRCVVRAEMVAEVPPWPSNDATEALFATWQGVALETGLPLEAERRGGLSDGNFLWRHVPTLDGLGPYGDNDHCSQRSADGSKTPEYVHLPSIVPKAVLNTLALRRLIEAPRD